MINWFKKLFNKKNDVYTATPTWTSTTFPSMLQSAYVPNVPGPFVRNTLFAPGTSPDKLYDPALFDYIVQQGLDKDNEAFIEYEKQEKQRKLELITGLIRDSHEEDDFSVYDSDVADALKEWLDETMPENHRVYIKMAYGI